MGHWTLPEIKRCCFCIPLRYGLIVWGYITLTINLIFLSEKIATIHGLTNKDDHDYNSVLYKIGELMATIVDLGLVIVLIVAAHKKNVKWLKISLIGNLASLIVYTLYTIYMIWYCTTMIRFLYTILDAKDINPILWLLAGMVTATCIEISLKFYIMFLLRKEIKKLETNSQFSFENNATEAKCKMVCDVEMENGVFKPIKFEDEEKAEENTFDKQTVEIGEVIEIAGEKFNNSFNNMTETKCRMEYENAITNEEFLFLINNDYGT